MRNANRLWVLGLALMTTAVVAGSAGAQTITGLTTANASSANEFSGTAANPVFERTSVVNIDTQTSSSFTAHYQSITATDGGPFSAARTATLSSDYTVSFNVTAPSSYQVNVTHSLSGALTLVDDGGNPASAACSQVTGTQTG